jgi:cardiolipin synthase
MTQNIVDKDCKWHFCLSSVDTWQHMFGDCQAAKREIDFEQFIFTNDEREGVKVRLLCDTVGSWNMTFAGTLRELREAGVEVLFFTPINPLRLNYLKWFYRDHKKILVVDGEIAYTGGVGIQKEFEGWRDTHVRIVGEPIVSEIKNHFEIMWRIAKEEKFYPFPYDRNFKNGFRFVENVPYAGRKELYYELVGAIKNAQEYVWITTPYFIPSLRLLRAIKRAAKRGAEVRLLLPLVSDSTWVNIASRFYFEQLLKLGVRINQYRSKMIHTKAVIVDDKWGTVGSMNMDNLSFHFNYEANLVSNNKQFIGDLKEHFLEDLKLSTHVVRKEWEHRPWKDKLLEKLTVPLHPVL